MSRSRSRVGPVLDAPPPERVPRMRRRRKGRFNDRKLVVMRLLSEVEVSNTKGVSQPLGNKISNVNDCLLRLYRDGLVHREKEVRTTGRGRPPFLYVLTNKGIERLAYLRDRMEGPLRRSP